MYEILPASAPAHGGPTDVRGLFERIDSETAEFRAATGLECPPMCGRCCLAPDVFTTAEELAPLAEELVRRGEAGAWLERLAANAGERRCALYLPSAEDPSRGRCSMYAWRPTVCRLFGFSARRDKHGRPELVACGVHRDVTPDAVRRAREHVATGGHAPMMAEHARQVAYLHPGSGAEELAINEAMARALRAAGLRAELAAVADALAGEPDDPRIDPPAHRPAA